MRIIKVKGKDGKIYFERVLEYGKDKIPYYKYKECGVVRKMQASRLKSNKPWRYYNLITTFDIETTTIKETHEGFMYIWQFCLGEDVIIGRRWEDFFGFLKEIQNAYDISKDKIFVVYVHNLAFEFQFIKDFFDWSTIFATGKREVLKSMTDNGIEFRCSYKLSNMSLEKFCENSKNCLHVKQVGDIDYSIFRTPNTFITDEELAYCYCDVKGLAECLEDYLEDDTLATIPLTSTGFIRRECRIEMNKNPYNHKQFMDMRIDKTVYLMLKKALRGGNTHGSRFLCDLILSDVRNFDVASSYPYCQLCKYFPVTKFKRTPVKNKEFFEKEIEKRCCLFTFYADEIEVKDNVPIPYIAYSKLEHSEKCEKFNGRVLSAEAVVMTLTEIDYQIIKKQYNIKGQYIGEMYTAKRGKLPKEMRQYIKYRFEMKTQLKSGDPYFYMKSKNKLNGIFGMTCTDIVHDIYKLIYGKWEEEKEDIDKALNKFYSNSNSFLTYAWGVWTTAHARAHLQRIIDITGADGTAYADTDSDKCINPDMALIDKLNADIIKEVEREGAYCDWNGRRYYMGVFEEDKPYKRFKTLGAKKYAYEDVDGNLHITISGVSKKNGAEELKRLENFRPGFTFKNAGGHKVWYNDDVIHYLDIGDEHILTASNVGMEDREYTIGLTGEFLENTGLNYLKILDNLIH